MKIIVSSEVIAVRLQKTCTLTSLQLFDPDDRLCGRIVWQG
jgi:hypothetical protein